MSPAGDIRRRPDPAEGSEAARRLRGKPVDIEEGPDVGEQAPRRGQGDPEHQKDSPDLRGSGCEPPPSDGGEAHHDHADADKRHDGEDPGRRPCGRLAEAQPEVSVMLSILAVPVLLFDRTGLLLYGLLAGYAAMFAFGWMAHRRIADVPPPAPMLLFELRILPILMAPAGAATDSQVLLDAAPPLAAAVGMLGGGMDGMILASRRSRRLPPFGPGGPRAILRGLPPAHRLTAAAVAALLAVITALVVAGPKGTAG